MNLTSSDEFLHSLCFLLHLEKQINCNLLLGNDQRWRCSKIHFTYTKKKSIERKMLDHQSWAPETWPNTPYLWGYGRLRMKNWEAFLLFHWNNKQSLVNTDHQKMHFPFQLSLLLTPGLFMHLSGKILFYDWYHWWVCMCPGTMRLDHYLDCNNLEGNAIPETGINNRWSLEQKLRYNILIQSKYRQCS